MKQLSLLTRLIIEDVKLRLNRVKHVKLGIKIIRQELMIPLSQPHLELTELITIVATQMD